LKISYELVKVLVANFGEEHAEKIAQCFQSDIEDHFESAREPSATNKDI